MQVSASKSEDRRYNHAHGKRYDQYCPVVTPSALVGERWALLVVRELLKGPKRYTDLLDGLPGIGTNILAARLRELEAGGVVRKRKLPAARGLDRLRADRVRHSSSKSRSTRSPAGAPARSARPARKTSSTHDWGLNAFAALLDREAARG